MRWSNYNYIIIKVIETNNYNYLVVIVIEFNNCNYLIWIVIIKQLKLHKICFNKLLENYCLYVNTFFKYESTNNKSIVHVLGITIKTK